MSKSEIRERLDTSDEFYKKFAIHDGNLQKQMGLYELENVNNPNIRTIAINPKEYFKKFRNKLINKKHKGERKAMKGICFKAFANRIIDLNQKAKQKKMIQKRFQVKNTEIKMTTVNKVQFASLNDKLYYCPDGITSLPYGHWLLL